MHLTNAIKSDNGETIFMATARLKALCPRIQQYDMPFVEGLVDELTNIETEIRKDDSYDSITNFLQILNTKKQIKRGELFLVEQDAGKIGKSRCNKHLT